MARLRYNNALGTLGASLGSGAGPDTITFAAAPPFSTLVSPDYIPLVLDPASSTPNASFEIVHLTAYTVAGTTGTIARAQEGTTSQAHASGAAWLCGPVIADMPSMSSLALPQHAWTSTQSSYQSQGHSINVTTATGLVMFYYCCQMIIVGAGTGGAAAAMFIDGTAVTGTVDGSGHDVSLTMSGSTNPIFFYSTGYPGAISFPAQYAGGSGVTRQYGSRVIDVTAGMGASGGGAGQVGLGGPVMLNLSAGTHTLEVKYKATVAASQTVYIGGGTNDIMMALGF